MAELSTLAAEATGSGEPLLAGAVLFAVLVLAFSVVAVGLSRFYVTAPLAFVVVGAVLGFAAGPLDGASAADLKSVAEVTLVLILFHDAAQVRPSEIGADRGAVSRLLLIGFPLTVVLGMLVATMVFPGLSLTMALLLAAALAPTDAGLGAATVLNPVVPARVRRLLNVESGLNDGLATPIVLAAIAALAGAEGLAARETVTGALAELAIGVLVGVLVGAGGAVLVGASRARRLSSTASRALAVLVLPLLAYGTALLVGGNGFVAAFVAGTAFAGAARWLPREESVLELTEALSTPLGYLVWLVVGMVAVPLVWHSVGTREVLFAVLALTVLRMVPVAICLIGTGLRMPSVAFIGWFGPRGLASVIFALIAVESLDTGGDLDRVLATICLTVLVSVAAHGFSADPLARRYGAWVAHVRPAAELAEPGLAAEPEPAGRRPRGARHWATTR